VGLLLPKYPTSGFMGSGRKRRYSFACRGVAKKEFDNHFFGPNLGCESAQTVLVLIGRGAVCELIAKLFGHSFLEASRGLVVKAVRRLGKAQRVAELVLRKALHPDQDTAAVSFSARPAFDIAGDLFPSAKVEVTHAEVSSLGKFERLPQRGKQLLVDVIEDARHPLCYSGDR
jgi:hypothetical protein